MSVCLPNSFKEEKLSNFSRVAKNLKVLYRDFLCAFCQEYKRHSSMLLLPGFWKRIHGHLIIDFLASRKLSSLEKQAIKPLPPMSKSIKPQNLASCKQLKKSHHTDIVSLLHFSASCQGQRLNNKFSSPKKDMQRRQSGATTYHKM